MANVLLTGLSADVDALYSNPVAVALVTKLGSFPTLQSLGFAGQLSYMAQEFHGLKDFNAQMAVYSATSDILKAAWATISKIAPLNSVVLKDLFVSPTMGPVGNAFLEFVSLTQVFAMQATEIASTPASSVLSANMPGAS